MFINFLFIQIQKLGNVSNNVLWIDISELTQKYNKNKERSYCTVYRMSELRRNPTSGVIAYNQILKMREIILEKPLITYRCQKIAPCFSRRVHNNARPFSRLCRPKIVNYFTNRKLIVSKYQGRWSDPKHWSKQCYESVTFWYRSGSMDPYYEVRIRNQIRIWILLFSSVVDKMPTQYDFLFQRVFAYYFWFIERYIYISL